MPFGWFAVAFAAELRPGAIVTRRFLDSEVVIFASESGEITAIDPYCPHMGAHLGHGGKVVGNAVECPFHGFRWNGSGMCQSTPYGKPLDGVRLRTWPVRNCLGVILIYHGSDNASEPEWEIDLPEDDPDWHSIQTRRLFFKTHPQEVNENGLDYAHFSAVHKFVDFEVLAPLTFEETRMMTQYAGTRPVPIIGGIKFNFDSIVHGMGFSLVTIRIQGGWEIRQMVLPTPVAAREVDIYIGISARRRGRSGLRRLLLSPVDRLVGRIVLEVVAFEVTRDKKIWDHKKYVRHPKLIAGDGPIRKYRRWARQFYPEAQTKILFPESEKGGAGECGE